MVFALTPLPPQTPVVWTLESTSDGLGRKAVLQLLVRQPARGPMPAAGARVTVGIDPESIHVF